MDHIALDHPHNRVHQTVQSESCDLPLSQLFDLKEAAQRTPPITHQALDEVAKVLGTSSKDAVSKWAAQVKTPVLSAATTRWQTYWHPNATGSS